MRSLVRNKRVAFVGASGTGKSALAHTLKKTLGLEFNPVGSRSVAAEMGFANPYDVDAAGQREQFQQRLVNAKMRWETERESFVTDRTPIDNLAYTVLHAPRSIESATLWQVRQGMQRYTHVVFCPMASFFELGDDPARIHERAYHEVYEAICTGFLTQVHESGLRGKFWYLQETGFADRCKRVLEFVGI